MLHDNLFLTDVKWPHSKFYAKPQLRFAVGINSGNGTGMGIKSEASWEWDWEWV